MMIRWRAGDMAMLGTRPTRRSPESKRQTYPLKAILTRQGMCTHSEAQQSRLDRVKSVKTEQKEECQAV
jgi:hypothetical protein